MRKILFIAALLLVACAAADDTCQILILQAGGDLGSFEVGAVKGLVNTLPAEQVEYDVVSGISVGSINAFGISQYPIGDEEEMADAMINFWLGIDASNIYKQYPLGLIQGLLFEKGLFDTSPERAILTKNAVTLPHRKLNVGAANLATGLLDRFDERDHTLPELVQVLMASSAVPGIFPYQIIDGKIYIDGGTVNPLDYKGAIDRCRETVTSDSQIVIDSIYVQFALNVEDWTAGKRKNPYQVYQRSNQITTFSSTYRNIAEAYQYNPTINFRHIIRPLKALPNAKAPYFFKKTTIQSVIQEGISNTEQILSNETSYNVQAVQTEAINGILKDWSLEGTESNREFAKQGMMNRLSIYKKLKSLKM